jgi:hypothetical protein
MPVQRYRIKDSTIAMFSVDGVHVARTVAAGTVVELSSGRIDGDKLIEVTWEGRSAMMFTQDLRSRAEAVSAFPREAGGGPRGLFLTLPLKKLHRSLVLLRSVARIERAEVFPFAGGILFA